MGDSERLGSKSEQSLAHVITGRKILIFLSSWLQRQLSWPFLLGYSVKSRVKSADPAVYS